MKPCRPKPVLRQVVQTHGRKKEETRKRAIDALVAKRKAKDEETAQKETSKRLKFEEVAPTAEDDAETQRFNEGLGPLKTEISNLPFLLMGTEAEFLDLRVVGGALVNPWRENESLAEAGSEGKEAEETRQDDQETAITDSNVLVF